MHEALLTDPEHSLDLRWNMNGISIEQNDERVAAVLAYPELLVSRKKDEPQGHSTISTNQGVRGSESRMLLGPRQWPPQGSLSLQAGHSQRDSLLGVIGRAKLKCFTIKVDGGVNVSRSSQASLFKLCDERFCA